MSVSPVLLSGATGQIGVFAIPTLLSGGAEVIALSRRAALNLESRLHDASGTMTWVRPESIGEQAGMFASVRSLLSCGPIQLAAQLVEQCPKLRRVVCVSTSSIYTKRESEDEGERALIAEIRAAEEQLSRLCKTREIPLVLLRPTLVYGCGMDENISRIAGLIRRFHVFPVAGEARGLRQPVHAADLAELMVRIVNSPEAADFNSPVGGGSIVSYRRMVELVFISQGLKPRVIAVPPGLLTCLASLLDWVPGLRGINAGFVQRQNRDQVFEHEQLKSKYNFTPRPFEPSGADFQVPEYARILQAP